MWSFKKKPVKIEEKIEPAKKETFIKFYIKEDGIEADYGYDDDMEFMFVKMLKSIQNGELEEHCLKFLPPSCVEKYNYSDKERPLIEPIYAYQGKQIKQ